MKARIFFVLLVSLLLIPAARMDAGVQEGVMAGPGEATVSAPASEEPINQLLTGLILKQIPHTWERNRGWGTQQERWDGIEWERDGLRLETRRKWKLVNHGTWRKYSVALTNPAQTFRAAISGIRTTADGRVAFSADLSAAVTFHARQAEWVTGVQLYSVSAEGSAMIHLNLDLEVGIGRDPAPGSTDLVIEPQITGGQLQVTDFRVDRVSGIGGEFAQQVTRFARKELNDELVKRNGELVTRLNTEIAEHAGDLRFSLSDVLGSQWGKVVRELLGVSARMP